MANRKPVRYCSVPQCERPYRSNGFCGSHDEQAKRGITPVDQFKPFKRDPRRCGVRGCARDHYARGTCRVHYGICNAFSLDLKRLQDIYDAPCGICGDAEAVIHVDHDHRCCPTGRSCGLCVRGGLCGTCNMALGAFKDSQDILRQAISYLAKTTR